MEEISKEEVFTELLKSWRKRLLLAGLFISVMVMLPEEVFFRIDVLRSILMTLAVSIVVYPAFGKVSRCSFMSKRMGHTLAYFLLCPTLFSAIVMTDMFYLEEITLAGAFFLIVLFLIVFWLLFEASLLQTRPPEKLLWLNPNQKHSTDASENALFLTDPKEEK